MLKSSSNDSEELAKTDSSPEKPVKMRFVGAIDGMVRDAAFALIVGNGSGQAAKELLKILDGESDALRDELAGPKAPAIERLLAERIATCSALASTFDYQYTWALKNNKSTSAEFWSKEADRANNRLLKAVAVLAQVRKVGTVVQVNVAEKQVNIAGAVTNSE